MSFDPYPKTTTEDLRPPERRLLTMLRTWPHGEEAQMRLWAQLREELGQTTTIGLMSAFEEFDTLLRGSAWYAPRIQNVESERLTHSEQGLLRLFETSLNGPREEALHDAGFWVRPNRTEDLVSISAQVAFLAYQKCLTSEQKHNSLQ